MRSDFSSILSSKSLMSFLFCLIYFRSQSEKQILLIDRYGFIERVWRVRMCLRLNRSNDAYDFIQSFILLVGILGEIIVVLLIVIRRVSTCLQIRIVPCIIVLPTFFLVVIIVGIVILIEPVLVILSRKTCVFVVVIVVLAHVILIIVIAVTHSSSTRSIYPMFTY